MVVSPWTRGGNVVSEVFDHTSTLRLIEQRFNVSFPTISPWRRTVCGDLTSVFDFENPDYSWPTLPNTSAYVNQSLYECANLPMPVVPSVQSMPSQEPGTRPARVLPYIFYVSDSVDASSRSLTLTIQVNGTAGAAFALYDLIETSSPTKKYTVGAGQSLSATLTLASGLNYDYVLHGPNGFVRRFTGLISGASSSSDSFVSYDVAEGVLVVSLVNEGASPVSYLVRDNVYGTGGPWAVSVPSNSVSTVNVSVTSSGNWYDVSVELTQPSSSQYIRRSMVPISPCFPSLFFSSFFFLSLSCFCLLPFSLGKKEIPRPAFR
jgi:phospholipase C